jgi:hypothetical protein
MRLASQTGTDARDYYAQSRQEAPDPNMEDYMSETGPGHYWNSQMNRIPTLDREMPVPPPYFPKPGPPRPMDYYGYRYMAQNNASDLTQFDPNQGNPTERPYNEKSWYEKLRAYEQAHPGTHIPITQGVDMRAPDPPADYWGWDMRQRQSNPPSTEPSTPPALIDPAGSPQSMNEPPPPDPMAPVTAWIKRYLG